ncbi:MAG TPA: 3-phosphoshikimate 1-carboxyvinyltransferase [Bacteroidales bacterium]|nr:3-phosphoshikimate 1-carboxyvinyltransferase [Bacteroidales bacterium]
MTAKVSAGEIDGKVVAPASKSAMQRYVAAALLARGESVISVSSFCDDIMAALSIARSLGAGINIRGTNVTIKGGFNPISGEVSCGESGLSARMFTPIAALHNGTVVINGRGSVLKRPLGMIEKPLADLGVSVVTNKGYLPVSVTGPVRGGKITADGSVSSQFITGLLMALPCAERDSVLSVINLASKPYIDLTLGILEEFGIKVVNDNYSSFIIGGNQEYKAGRFSVEGDWSGGAFLLVTGAIGGKAEVSGLLTGSTQADRAVLNALELAGANVHLLEESIIVEKSSLRAFEFNLSDCPDLAPPLAVLAMGCKGRSVLTGTERLLAKESDRGRTLEESLGRIGGKIRNFGNRIEIEGVERLKGGKACSHNDHRIAMALASSAVLCDSEVIVEGMECINKSYPGFVDDFRKLGGKVVISN